METKPTYAEVASGMAGEAAAKADAAAKAEAVTRQKQHARSAAKAQKKAARQQKHDERCEEEASRIAKAVKRKREFEASGEREMVIARLHKKTKATVDVDSMESAEAEAEAVLGAKTISRAEAAAFTEADHAKQGELVSDLKSWAKRTKIKIKARLLEMLITPMMKYIDGLHYLTPSGEQEEAKAAYEADLSDLEKYLWNWRIKLGHSAEKGLYTDFYHLAINCQWAVDLLQEVTRKEGLIMDWHYHHGALLRVMKFIVQSCATDGKPEWATKDVQHLKQLYRKKIAVNLDLKLSRFVQPEEIVIEQLHRGMEMEWQEKVDRWHHVKYEQRKMVIAYHKNIPLSFTYTRSPNMDSWDAPGYRVALAPPVKYKDAWIAAMKTAGFLNFGDGVQDDRRTIYIIYDDCSMGNPKLKWNEFVLQKSPPGSYSTVHVKWENGDVRLENLQLVESMQVKEGQKKVLNILSLLEDDVISETSHWKEYKLLQRMSAVIDREMKDLSLFDNCPPLDVGMIKLTQRLIKLQTLLASECLQHPMTANLACKWLEPEMLQKIAYHDMAKLALIRGIHSEYHVKWLDFGSLYEELSNAMENFFHPSDEGQLSLKDIFQSRGNDGDAIEFLIRLLFEKRKLGRRAKNFLSTWLYLYANVDTIIRDDLWSDNPGMPFGVNRDILRKIVARTKKLTYHLPLKPFMVGKQFGLDVTESFEATTCKVEVRNQLLYGSLAGNAEKYTRTAPLGKPLCLPYLDNIFIWFREELCQHLFEKFTQEEGVTFASGMNRISLQYLPKGRDKGPKDTCHNQVIIEANVSNDTKFSLSKVFDWNRNKIRNGRPAEYTPADVPLKLLLECHDYTVDFFVPDEYPDEHGVYTLHLKLKCGDTHLADDKNDELVFRSESDDDDDDDSDYSEKAFEKEREAFEKEREAFEKEREAFEKKRKAFEKERDAFEKERDAHHDSDDDA